MDKIYLDDILFQHWIWDGQFKGDEFDQLSRDAVCYESPHHLMRIKDSIHYKALATNDFTTYNRFCETTRRETETHRHTEKRYRELIDNFDTSRLLEDKITLNWHERTNKYVVSNGRHRLSILSISKNSHGLKLVAIPRDYFIICEGYLPR